MRLTARLQHRNWYGARRRLRRPRWMLVVVLSLAALVAPACSSGGSGATSKSGFGKSRFEDIPLLVRTKAVGPRSDKGGEITRSYETRGFTPRQVMDRYEARLKGQGWTPVGPIKQIGPTAYRGSWTRKGRRLVVSASHAGALNADSSQLVVQYNLMLSET